MRGVWPVQGFNSSGSLENEVELERGRGRQGLLPDFKMEIPSPAGEPIQILAELKIIGAVPKWYLRSGGLARKKKAVLWREEQPNYQLSIELH